MNDFSRTGSSVLIVVTASDQLPPAPSLQSFLGKYAYRHPDIEFYNCAELWTLTGQQYRIEEVVVTAMPSLATKLRLESISRVRPAASTWRHS